MDPAVDTGFDEGVNEDANAVNTSSLEAATYGNRIPPELYPTGPPEEPAAANPIPGNEEADIVRAGPLAANGLAHDPLPHHEEDALPVPPQQFQDAAKDAQENAQEAAAANNPTDDEDEDMGDDLFGEGAEDDDEQDIAAQASPVATGSPQPVASRRTPSPSDDLTAEERARRRALEYDEEDLVERDGDSDGGHADAAAEMMQHEEVIAQIPLANFSVPAGGKVWHARMPHFLQIATGAFDEQTWQPEDLAASDSQQQDDVKPRTVPDENVIRWRWSKDELGQVIKESNARIVRWSDGTLSLQLGSEMFDMTLALDDSATLTATGGAAAAAAGSAGVNPQTSGLVPSAFDLARGHGLTYLSARHTYAGTPLSETQASVHGTMSFRPATLASQTHRRLAGSIAGRYANQGRRGTQKADMPTMDPERARQQREKQEVERQKKVRREAAKAAGGSGRRSGGRNREGKKATTIEGLDLGSEDEDDEEEDDDAAGGYDAYRRAQPKRGKGGPLNRDYEDEDDDDGFLAKSDEEMEEVSGDREELEEADEAAERAARRRKDLKKRRDYESDSDDGEASREEAGAAKAAADEAQAAPRRRLVVESDEEE